MIANQRTTDTKIINLKEENNKIFDDGANTMEWLKNG